MISLPLQRAKDRRWYVPFGRSSVRPSRALGSSYSRVSLDSVTNVCDGPPPHLSCALVPLALGFRHNPHSSPPNPLWIEQRGRRQDTREHGGDRVIKSKNAKKWRAREADIALADPPGKSSQAPSPPSRPLRLQKEARSCWPYLSTPDIRSNPKVKIILILISLHSDILLSLYIYLSSNPRQTRFSPCCSCCPSFLELPHFSLPGSSLRPPLAHTRSYTL